MEYELVTTEAVYVLESSEELEHFLFCRGVKKTGEQEQHEGGTKLNPVLVGQPTFAGLIGPMTGNNGSIRYETAGAYERMSK